MAIDRNKIRQNAEKFVRQGKLDQAISLFEQLINDTPRDMNLKNQVGDLFVRAGSVPDAVRIFTEVADFYSEEGFYLKAIAILKKINKLDPSSIECYYKLADLYAKQGLNSDAKNQFQQVAELYQKAGDVGKAAEAIEGLLKIDPDNFKMRARLAESYHKLNNNARSVQEYRTVGEGLAKSGKLEEAVKIFDKALGIDESNAPLAAGYIQALFDLGRMEETIQKARSLYSSNRENVGMLSVLAQAYSRTGEAELAKQVYEKLAGIEPDNPAWKERLGESKGARRPAPAAASPSRPIPDLAEMSGDYSMEELEEVSGEWAATSDPSPSVSAAGGEPGGEVTGGLVEGEKDEFIVEHMTEAEVFIKYGLVEKAIENIEAIVGRYPDEVESVRRLRDLYLETGNKAKAAEKCVDLATIARAKGDMPSALDLLAEARKYDPHVRLERPPAGAPQPVASADEYSFGGAGVAVDLDTGPPASGVELDFNLSGEGGGSAGSASGGLGLEAPARGMSLDFEEPEPAKGDSIEFQLDDDSPAEERGGIEFELDSPEPGGGGRASAAGEETSAEGAGGGDDGIEFFDNAIRAPRRDSPLEVAPAPPIGGGAEEADESLFEQETEFLSEAKETASTGAGAGAGSVGDDSLEEIFKEFKKGVEEQVDTEDYETHYNLGIAYREMGLVDEAIAEFQTASKDPNRFVDCCGNLGLCFREKGMPKLAVKWYGKALETVDADSAQYISILYELACAHEEGSDTEQALEAFINVMGLDSTFRDVAERIEKLGG